MSRRGRLSEAMSGRTKEKAEVRAMEQIQKA